jgi:hypothetical protein
MFHRIAIALSLAVACSTAVGYTPRVFSSGNSHIRWDLKTEGYPSDNVIPYVINPTRPAGAEILPAGTTEDDVVAAIRNVFQAYENVPTSKLRFEFLGVDHDAQFAEDGILLVTLDFTDPGVPGGAWSNFKDLLLAPNATQYIFDATGETVPIVKPYTLIDYDICLGNVAYSLDGTPGTLVLPGLLAHELGHMLGLGHSILQPCTMSGYPSSRQTTNHTLSHDEYVGISVLYPADDFEATTGTLDGRVVETGGAGEVFGAHLTVIDAATGVAVVDGVTGVATVDPITGRPTTWDSSGQSGRFVISGLAPGQYRIRVDAYDGPRTVASTNKIINMAFFDGDELGPRRDFGYLMSDTIYEVSPGVITDVGELETGPFDPDFPNVDAQIESRIDGVWQEPAIAYTGQTTELRIPRGVNAGPGDEFFIDGAPCVSLENAALDVTGTCILVDAVVPADAPLGAHNVVVQNEHGFSLIHGGLLIASGAPVIGAVDVACVTEGATIEVHGEHFTYDVQVLVDGLLASELQVVDAGLISAVLTDAATLPLEITVVSDMGVDATVVERVADVNGDGDVGFGDVLALIGAWGPCAACVEDLDGSGDVGFGDLLVIIAGWGPCSE